MKIIASTILTTLLLSVALAQTPADTTAAETVANAWLALIDSGKSAESWDKAASNFKAAVVKADWTPAVEHARAPFGSLKSRKLESATFTHTLPGAPTGDYVVIKYTSQFEHKDNAIETVTPMRDKDGTWRVAGYYIK